MNDLIRRIEESEDKIIKVSDGRKISYLDLGTKEGIPTFFFHGSPGSRYEGLFSEGGASKHNFRILSLDRPGFGKSDFKSKYSLLDYNNDIMEIADSLGFDKFGVIGISGGGTSVLSAAYDIPERLLFAVDLCGWAPVYKTGLAEYMAPLDKFFSKIARFSPKLFRLPFSYLGKKAKSEDKQEFLDLIKSSFGDADLEIIKDEEIAEFFVRDMKEAFSQGSKGPSWDAVIRYREWGFKLEDIDFKIHIFHGTEDKFVPMPFVEYKKEHLEDWEYTEYEDQGHLYILTKLNEILGKLISFLE
ncbi:MAG: hypothetical protein BAJALOKI2v1_460001 [Promethearchaeota archaeon]|nr:MAG: hypothetical protein BAJALOKI2v1_460001 [Candidatus Lokiarchaeota archaeon]